MKKALLLLLLLGALAGGGYYWQRSRALAASKDPQIPTATVDSGPIRLSVASTGRVVSNLDVEIKCKASGEVVQLPYDVSDSVQKDKLLVELDPVDEQRLVKQAEASLLASQAKLEQAKQNLLVGERALATNQKRAEAALATAEAHVRDTQAKADRKKTLLDKKLASEEDYDTARTLVIEATTELANAKVRFEEIENDKLALELKRQDIHLTEAQVVSDEVALSIAKQRLADTKVVAPIDGVVTARNVQIGQIISSGISNVGGGTTVLTLADLSRIFVLASVDESDIGKVKEGQDVLVTADAFPDKRFPGKVTRIAPRGVNASNVVTFEVKIEVLGKNKSLLRPEMTANVEILVAQKDDALRVPAEAVNRKNRDFVATVVKPDGATEERAVEVGIQDGTYTEIVSGLAKGETVRVQKREAESMWRKSGGRPPGSPMMLGGPRGKQ